MGTPNAAPPPEPAPDPAPAPQAVPLPGTPAGRAGLATLLAHPERAVVALDFDGTLADIVPDPAKARAHPGAPEALARLAPHLRAVAVITGRPAGVAVRLGGFDGRPGLAHLVVLGHYGAERWDAATGALHAPAPHPGIAAVQAELAGVLDRSGVWHGTWVETAVERKGGRAIAVHTRRAADPQRAFEQLRGPLTALAERHGLIVEPGRLVLELRPPGMDKGVALAEWVEETGAAAVLYAGDDLGDLAAFAAVEKLRSDATGGVLVCSGSSEVTELADRADLVVDGPKGVVALLNALADRIENPPRETPETAEGADEEAGEEGPATP
ncbi:MULTISPECIES: trehalose-phosphatase [unclassified Streptomyces]|uniref:trehalose-phosphatase n=1 Tax=unclassified Streptomyces TaxID=2593676 RepID=UPI0003612697|nr:MULTISPECIES: trehalose-phosphatase [unclassified Streptomyces]